jgi:hypothetical protein
MDDPKNKTLLEKRLADTKEWLGELDLKIIFNSQSLDLKHFEEKRIQKNSQVVSYQFRPAYPTFLVTKIKGNILADTTSRL